MAELKYDPVPHNQKAFLGKASKRRGFRKVYDALENEYPLAHEMLGLIVTCCLNQLPLRGRKITRPHYLSFERASSNTLSADFEVSFPVR